MLYLYLYESRSIIIVFGEATICRMIGHCVATRGMLSSARPRILRVLPVLAGCGMSPSGVIVATVYIHRHCKRPEMHLCISTVGK